MATIARGEAQPVWTRVSQSAVTGSWRATKNAMTATSKPLTGARPSAAWSVALFAMPQSLKAVLQSVGTGSVPVTRCAMTAILPMAMAAVPVKPLNLDGNATPRQHAHKQAVNRVQQANTSLMVCVWSAQQARTCPQRAVSPHRTAWSARRASSPIEL